ncbi:hypothetical protein BGZ46_009975 [Entomortierella lignicola]|nr:hypothetical protein BGZ46_009975 [Entomortierella lignicola]
MANRITVTKNILENVTRLSSHSRVTCTRSAASPITSRNITYISSKKISPSSPTLSSSSSLSRLNSSRNTSGIVLAPSENYNNYNLTRLALSQIRIFSTSGVAFDDGTHHFDTHRFVEKLEREGFSRKQSEAIMNALDEVVTESMDNLTKNMVTKADQEKTVYTYRVDFAALKSELQMLEKNDFSLTNTNNERLVSEIERLRQRLREEVARTQAGVRLDLNLEKGRIRDEAATQELKVRATEERIEQEIAALRTQMETIKLQTLQYMIGTITGAGALILAYLRMFK